MTRPYPTNKKCCDSIHIEHGYFAMHGHSVFRWSYHLNNLFRKESEWWLDNDEYWKNIL